jgi:CO/xanthine dehydrogenase FAD-binding subunit
MEFLQPTRLADALSAKAANPGAVPIAGGTDLMVDVNFDRLRPEVLLDLGRVEELRGWSLRDDTLRIGARVTFTEVIEEIGALAPALATAARTVGSPQIRNRGTIGGNLGSSSPAGDALPPLLASGGSVEVASVRGTRHIPIEEFFTGVKQNALDEDEIITAVAISPADGPQQFAKIGARNAMVIAVASFALVLRLSTRSVGTGLGSVAPTPRRAYEAERFLEEELAAGGYWDQRHGLPDATVERFAQLVVLEARPIDDVRGTAAYRSLGLSVLARRTLGWAWQELRLSGAVFRV